jgi:acetylornithine/N-succinyldiaminopimelate aminotransferase
MGRTGTLLACHGYEVRPDVVTLAKALGGGFPIGAMLVGVGVAEVLQFGSHGTTFGGNPLAAAVALAVLEHIASPALLQNVQHQSEVLRQGLMDLNARFNLFAEVRGRGLMLGAELKPEYAGRAADILDHAADCGLLLLQAGPSVLRMVPALNIDDAEVADGLQRLDAALDRFCQSGP